MIFKSRITNFTANVRHEMHKRHPVTGDIIETIPAIRAEFGQHLGEITYLDPDTGTMETGAEIRGGFFDTVSAQEKNGWTDEEREMVERRLIQLATNPPDGKQFGGECWVELHSEAPVAAPWPAYDKATNYLEIAKTAEITGTLAAALAYEKQNKKRDGVIAELEKRIADQTADDTLVAA